MIIVSEASIKATFFVLDRPPPSSYIGAVRLPYRDMGRGMARTVRNAKIDTRSSRARLTMRREPYWTFISQGCALGYRRGGKGGTWIAKFRDDNGQRHYEALGAADDARDPDGISVFSFAQAQERARGFFKRKAREAAGELAPHEGPYAVADALAAYLKAYERRGGKALQDTRTKADTHILPELGSLAVAKLTARKIEDWHHRLAETPARLRTKEGGEPQYRKIDRSAEGVRKRRATANRLLTVLKAALNHAWKAGHAASDNAWRRVHPFKAVETARIRYLLEGECARLANACEPDYRNLVSGALLTGCRYSELAHMEAADFNPEAGVVTVCASKANKPRHVTLTEEGQAHFSALTAGKTPTDPIFVRDDGGLWGKSHQRRPMLDACKRAKIAPAISFHILRHTYGATLAMRGVPMAVIAEQLGHADTRMTEKHYAHLAPSYVASTIRAHFPALGLVQPSAVVSMRRK
jgi:integrase